MQKKQRLLLLAGAVCILPGCLSLLLGKPAPATEKTEQLPMLSQLDTGVREAGQGAWTFSFSAQDFLTCCSGIYRQEQGRDFVTVRGTGIREIGCRFPFSLFQRKLRTDTDGANRCRM